MSSLSLASLLATLVAMAPNQAPPPPMIGFLHSEASRYEAEWRLHTGYYRTLVEHGLQGALVDDWPLYRRPARPGEFYQMLKPFHAVVLATREEGVHQLTDEVRRRCLVARDDLRRYVSEGGGLVVVAQSVRYPNDQDELFNNLLLEPFGVRWLHEGIFDKASTFLAPPTLIFPAAEFFFTSHVRPHPTTDGVRRLYLPRYGSSPAPGVEALGLDSGWETVVAAQPTAKSYRLGADNSHSAELEGSQAAAPPIAAVRSFGRGRVFVYSLHNKHAFLNYGNRMWPQITESWGDRQADRPSDSNRLLLNALRWTAETARGNPELGTHKLAAIEPVRFEAAVDWDAQRFGRPGEGVRGVLGAHTRYTDGAGTVAEFVHAARRAGLAFLVFTEPLELLTAAEFDRLKADCRAATSDEFYACPGVEFTDSLGVRWAAWGEKVVYPEESFVDKGKRFVVWDGRRIVCTGRYEVMCGFSPNAILDYRALGAAGAHPANLWWFYRIVPWAYDGQRLAADNLAEYLHALRDLRSISIDAFTRIRSPDEVASAAATCTSVMVNLSSARQLLNTRCGSGMLSTAWRHYVTQGPQILLWEAKNTQMEHPWQRTRGAQRVRVRLEVAAASGLAEVRIHDADCGLVRRFDAAGAQRLARQFEMVHDRQHWLVMEVVDRQGHRAVSPCQQIYCYKSGLYRCGDNLNILGSSMLCWHPDRNEMPSLAKIVEDGFKYTVLGIDSAAAVATQPKLFAQDYVNTTAGMVPPYGEQVVNKILDVPLASHNLQIYSTRMAYRSENYDRGPRPTPSMGPIARRLGPLEVFERHQTSYALQSRQDYFVTWNYRRPFEGSRDYRGGIVWHEGEVRFRKAVTLKGAVPVPLLITEGPGGADYGLYDQFLVTDRQAGTLSVRLEPGRQKPYYRAGRIRPGGYCATLNTDLGYLAFLADSHSDFSYSVHTHPQTRSLWGRTTIGLGADGQRIEAGTVLPYRFAMATLNDHRLSNELMEDMTRAYNLDGGSTGYPWQVDVGRPMDAQFFFTAEAQNHEARFTLGPRDLICDLPIRVGGLDDNGCAAVYVSGRNFFRFIGVSAGTAYFQEPILPAATLWVGNPFVCLDKAVRLALVIDGQSPGRRPRLEVHNPTDRPLQTTITSPPHTPRFGGLKTEVHLPAGDSVFFRIEQDALRPEGKVDFSPTYH